MWHRVIVVVAFSLSSAMADPAAIETGPRSRQAMFVESTTTGETLVRATGIGVDVEAAIADARKAAVWFVVYAGDRPLLERSATAQVEQAVFGRASEVIRYESGLKSKRRVGDAVRVELLVRVDVRALDRLLVEAGARQATTVLADAVGLPVIALRARPGDRAARIAAATVGEYLQDRGFEVHDLSAARAQDRLVEQLSTLDGIVDPTFRSAVHRGCDVLVKVEAEVARGRRYRHTTHQVAVSVSASEVASRAVVGSAIAHSPERVVAGAGVVTREAANDAADKLTAQIRAAWQRQTRRGRPFRVILQNADGHEDVERGLYDALRAIASRVKRQSAGTGLSAYLVQAHGLDDGYALFTALSDRWHGPGRLERIYDAGAFLVVQASADEAVVIEVAPHVP